MEYALVLLWLATYLGLGLAGLPLANRLFARFPDRGSAFAIPVALSVTTMVSFWVGHVAFGRWTAFLSVGVLVAISGLALRRDSPSWSILGRGKTVSDGSGTTAVSNGSGVTTADSDDIDSGDIDSDEIDPGRAQFARSYAEASLAFTVAFLLLVAVRSVDPAINPTGEKFLDFGILNSLLRASVLPPEDTWWAGESLNYYYGGHLVAATLTHLTGTSANHAYNLALSGFYAMLVTAAYGLAGAIAHARGTSRRIAGVLGGLFVGFSSNLVVPVTGAVWLLPDSLAGRVASWVAATLSEGNSGELVRRGLDAFWYWTPSRVIPSTINEFPLFSFLNGDLHAHMSSTPFLLLVAALGYAYFRTPAESSRRRVLRSRRHVLLSRRRLLVFVALPPVIGLVGLIDVWSFPTALGVTWLALLFAPAEPLSLVLGFHADGRLGTAFLVDRDDDSSLALRSELSRAGSSLAVTMVVAAIAVASIAPFVVGTLLRSTSGRGIGILPPSSSAMALVLVHGAFLSVFALYFWSRTRKSQTVTLYEVGFFVALAGLLAWSSYRAALVLVFPLVLVGWVLLRTDGDVGYETVLVVAGAGLVTLVEFVYLRDGTGIGRYNTVFKVYMQVWVLWGTTAGAVLGSLLASPGGPDWPHSLIGWFRTSAVPAFVVLLVVSTGLYGGLALSNHFTKDYHRLEDPTLNGTAYLQSDHPEEAAAIRWLSRRPGQPTLVSTPGYDSYSWTSAAASLTGTPTVIGWVRKSGLYHGHEAAERRANDVELVYTGTWAERAQRLRQWNVTYVYVGLQARERYDESNLQFDRYDGIEVAFRSDGVVIYRVDQSKL